MRVLLSTVRRGGVRVHVVTGASRVLRTQPRTEPAQRPGAGNKGVRSLGPGVGGRGRGVLAPGLDFGLTLTKSS